MKRGTPRAQEHLRRLQHCRAGRRSKAQRNIKWQRGLSSGPASLRPAAGGAHRRRAVQRGCQFMPTGVALGLARAAGDLCNHPNFKTHSARRRSGPFSSSVCSRAVTYRLRGVGGLHITAY
ncbi:hypothetical protein MPLB_1870013 [Mesorhizobium sp. ORS 3324]|nr:hypothetical protein MPLB_1870013 [Mesorhizobium sp. ORS 3324]